KLEQERLIYQARLQARFGRNWRRKAPVESMMPLRLAKYGVPLAETAPAGLAAAGIEPALLPPAPKAELPERVEAGGKSVLSIGRQRVGERADDAHESAGGSDGVPLVSQAKAVREASEPRPVPVLPDLDYIAAADAFMRQHGAFPDARQFALFLALYDITDPTTGQPLPEAVLEPVIDGLRFQYPAPEPVAEHLQHETGKADPAGCQPTEPVLEPEAAPVAERVRVRAARTSAWFGSGQETSSDEAPQAALEEVESWNDAIRDNTPEEQRPLSSSPSNAVAETAGGGGATADRTGQGRRVVQMRIPEPNDGKQAPVHAPRDGGEGSEREPAAEEPPVPETKALSGSEIVAVRYRDLPAEERAKSANALAPLIAEGTDYTVGTVRKYLGEIKRAEKKAAALP
ncbi:hypothetical protein ABT013_34130, partial [Streptomyces bacillaris]